MKIGIVIDEWKFPIFERHLIRAGYSFERVGFTEDTLLLTIFADDVQAAGDVVRAANAEAALRKS